MIFAHLLFNEKLKDSGESVFMSRLRWANRPDMFPTQPAWPCTIDLFFSQFWAATQTLLNFMKTFQRCHEENLKNAELERKKAEKEAEMEKAKGGK